MAHRPPPRSACACFVHAYGSTGTNTPTGVRTCWPQASMNMSLRNPRDVSAQISSHCSQPLPSLLSPPNIWSHLVLIRFSQTGLGTHPEPGREARFSLTPWGFFASWHDFRPTWQHVLAPPVSSICPMMWHAPNQPVPPQPDATSSRVTDSRQLIGGFSQVLSES